MIDFILLDANTCFSIALLVVLMIVTIELLGLLTGFSLSDLFDQLFSDPVEMAPQSLSFLADWLFLGKLPFMIWLLITLSVFTITGYTANYFAIANLDKPLPAIFNIPIAIASSMVFVRVIGHKISAIFSQQESSAISTSSFAGQIASITLGKATLNNPAEAVLVDQYQQKHYILVMPCSSDESFLQGEEVVLVEKKQSFWTAIKFSEL